MKASQETVLISVVVPIYNTERYLARCIDSIINQTYRNLEIILVDDGSTDGSGEICDVYAKADARVKVIHKQNGGQADARCSGIEIAKGDYLGFVDSDDWIACEMYENLLYGSLNYDLITSGIQRHDDTGGMAVRLTDALPPGTYETKTDMEQFFDNLVICKCGIDGNVAEGLLHSECSKLFRMPIVREMYKEANIPVRNGEDWLFCILYALRCNSVKVTHENYYHYMFREDSTVNNENMDYLKESNELYLAINKALKGHWMEKSIRQQCQRWFLYRVMEMMPRFLNFDNSVALPHFICPYFDKLQGKKIVLFGSGRVGRDYYRELVATGHDVVLWVDNYNYGVSYCGKEIYPSDSLKSIEYDFILCALFSREKADEIRSQLIGMGVLREKILWSKPYDFIKSFLMR